MKLYGSKRKVWAYLIVVILVFSLAGCKSSAKNQVTDNQSKNTANSFPMVLTDDLGRNLTLDKAPSRIVSLAPSNTEILFYLGLGDKVVGNTTYCNYPEAAKNCTKVGGFADPSLEKVVALKPDLVLATDIHKPLLESLEDAGMKVLVLDPKTIEGIISNIQLVGKACGVENKAIELNQVLTNRINAVNEKIANIPDNQRPTVYCEIWDQPLMSVGKDSLIGQVIRMAGGINMTDDSGEEYPQISAEIVIARNPAVMINSYGMGSAKVVTPAEIAGRKGWSQLAFIKNDRIYSIHSDLLNRSAPRIVDGIEKMAQCLYPELFK